MARGSLGLFSRPGLPLSRFTNAYTPSFGDYLALVGHVSTKNIASSDHDSYFYSHIQQRS